MNKLNKIKEKCIYSLQGNISSGKSEILNKLERQNKTIKKEPIQQWESLLNREHRKRGSDFGVHIQTRICTTLSLREYSSWLKSSEQSIFVERNLDSAKEVFIPSAKWDKTIDVDGTKTLEILYITLENLRAQTTKQWEEMYKVKINHKIVYIRSEPAKCFERLKTRNQAGDEYITLNYLEKIHLMHEKWLLGKPQEVITLEENLSLSQKIDILKNL